MISHRTTLATAFALLAIAATAAPSLARGGAGHGLGTMNSGAAPRAQPPAPFSYTPPTYDYTPPTYSYTPPGMVTTPAPGQ
jgi:hypothetical protein